MIFPSQVQWEEKVQLTPPSGSMTEKKQTKINLKMFFSHTHDSYES